MFYNMDILFLSFSENVHLPEPLSEYLLKFVLKYHPM